MTLLLARNVLRGWKTKIPLMTGLISVITTILSALFFGVLIPRNPIVALLSRSAFPRSDIAGLPPSSCVLHIHSGTGSVRASGYIIFSRDFGASYKKLWRLLFQSF